mmetsp:Transcript_29762/g.86718  ORF Transcript_29762/g.86718 Transcript_29762/m.86718 type:complete len:261 (-) Transcript_29762:780-1562(-)
MPAMTWTWTWTWTRTTLRRPSRMEAPPHLPLETKKTPPSPWSRTTSPKLPVAWPCPRPWSTPSRGARCPSARCRSTCASSSWIPNGARNRNASRRRPQKRLSPPGSRSRHLSGPSPSSVGTSLDPPRKRRSSSSATWPSRPRACNRKGEGSSGTATRHQSTPPSRSPWPGARTRALRAPQPCPPLQGACRHPRSPPREPLLEHPAGLRERQRCPPLLRPRRIHWRPWQPRRHRRLRLRAPRAVPAPSGLQAVARWRPGHR